MSVAHHRRSILALVAGLGAALIAVAWILEWRESARRSAPPPEPAWRTPERSAGVLRQQIRPSLPSDSLAVTRAVAALKAQALAPMVGPIRFQMTRSFDSGLVFDSELTLAWQPSASGLDLELSVEQAAQPLRWLRIAIRDDAVTSVDQATGDLPVAWQPWSSAAALPVAIGDLQIGEVVVLLRRIRATQFVPLGLLAGHGARPQYVFEASLVPQSRDALPLPTQTEALAVGARAWACVDSATCELRSVRVLDARGYVVRVYEDPVWEAPDPRPTLHGLRVTALPSGSHTVFHRLTVDRP